MKNKIIILIALAVIFAPAVSSAMMLPQMNLTIVVNTQNQDSSFNFNSKKQITTCDPDTHECFLVWVDYKNFALQTQNLTVSTILNNTSFGSYLFTQEVVPGLKVSNVFCTSDNSDDVFSYYPNGVEVTVGGWSNATCIFNNVVAQGKTPVLIVPGLTGTEMFKNSEKLWPDSARMMLSISDNFMDPLGFSKELTPIDNNVIPEKVVSRELIFDYTEGLVNQFVWQGYTENQDLFTFPYDWRYGVTGVNLTGKTNSDLLDQKIQDILAQTGSDKVDVIAHSMGGLIVKKYVMQYPADNHIGKAVFVGVPNIGAPKAVKVLLQGDNLGVPGLSDSEIKKISQNMPAIYDLLPSQQYYDVKGSYVETIDRTKCSNDSSVPCDVKDLSYQEANNFLNSQGSNSVGITNATSLHTQNFDNFDLRTAGIDLYAIDGCKAATLGKVIQTKYNDIFGQQISYDRRLIVGDNTVPLESATNLPINQNNKYYALISDHGKMMSQSGIRQEIVNLISGSNLDIGTACGEPLVTQDISKCQLTGEVISVFSPVNIFVTDQYGNKLGLVDDGSTINEIPNADFEVWGEHKFVYLPTDEGQTYSVSLQGTGSGTYTIKVDNMQNNQIMGAEVFENLPVTNSLIGSINIAQAGAQTTIDVKAGQGLNSEIILPTRVLSAVEAENYLPPILVPDMPTSKDQCKKNGWKDFGNTFKNQGDCVSFVEMQGNKKKNK